MKPWLQTSKEAVMSTALFKIFKAGFKSQDSDKQGMFDILETKDWMNVVPITTDGKVILVRQFRFGTQELTLEFPAGCVERGEDPQRTAERELAEETGSTAAKIVRTGACRPNPAIQGNTCHMFAAYDVSFGGQQSLDPNEEIELELRSIEEVDRMVREGEITHALSVVAWHFYKEAQR